MGTESLTLTACHSRNEFGTGQVAMTATSTRSGLLPSRNKGFRRHGGVVNSTGAFNCRHPQATPPSNIANTTRRGPAPRR
eukprot:8703700-Alexandrium_andersonii.AAC.2